jgi:hypothetical protein
MWLCLLYRSSDLARNIRTEKLIASTISHPICRIVCNYRQSNAGMTTLIYQLFLGIAAGASAISVYLGSSMMFYTNSRLT